MTYEELMDTRRQLFIEENELNKTLAATRWEMIASRMADMAVRTGGGSVRGGGPEPPNEEMGGSPSGETWTFTDLTATRTFKCAWADRHDLAYWLVTPPDDAYPYAPLGMAYANRIGIEPFGEACSYDVDGLAQYETSIVTIGYGTLQGNPPSVPPPSGATLIEEQVSPSLELVSMDVAGLQWGSGAGTGLVGDKDVPVYRKLQVAYTVTLYGVPSVSSNMINYGGYCHSLAYTSPLLGWTFPAQTLMYSPPTMTRSVSLLGTQGWTVSCPWLYQPQGWNKFLNMEKLDGTTDPWEEVYYSDGTTRVRTAPPTDLSWFLP